MKQFVFASFLAVLAGPVFAGELASSEQITTAIAGNTVQGGMSDGTAYVEFYAADGTIKADGYSGSWTVENDEMCFDYGEGSNCWAVTLTGDQVVWIQEGEETGTGTILSGNPNDF